MMELDLLFSNLERRIQLDLAEKEHIVRAVRVRTFARKELLLREGQVCRFEHFVLSGCLRVYRLDETGQEHTLHFCPEDWWISDLYSFLTQKPATLYIEAVEPSVVAMLEKESLEQLYAQVPKLERFFRIILQNAFIALQERIMGNIAQPAEERYEAFKVKYPGLEQRMPQYLIASYLGITPEFLSKIRARPGKK